MIKVAAGVAYVTLVVLVIALAIIQNNMQTRIDNLEHACIPTYTGGGVWQCAQPNVFQTTRY